MSEDGTTEAVAEVDAEMAEHFGDGADDGAVEREDVDLPILEEIDRQEKVGLGAGDLGGVMREPAYAGAAETLEERVQRFIALEDGDVNYVNRLLGGQMEFIPRGDRVLVILYEGPDEIAVAGTDKKIEIPKTAKPEMRGARGVVLAVGPGRMLENGQREPMDLHVGDSVQHGKFAGQRMDVPKEEREVLSGMKLAIMKADDIHGSWRELVDVLAVDDPTKKSDSDTDGE